MSLAVIVFGIAAAAILYILFGYPIVLALRTQRRAPPVAKDLQYQTSVSLIMAVHNGATHLAAKMESIFALHYPRELLQIIIVSDGSTDDTVRIAKAQEPRGVEVIVLPHGGKAVALNQAFKKASGEILFFTDVRQALDPHSLRHLVANFADPSVGAVTGEMQLRKGDAGEQADMDLYWRYELWARLRHSEIDSLFNTTGCIYAMRRNLAKPLPADTLSDDAALPLGAFFAGYRVIFDPEAIAVDDPAVAGSEPRRRFRNLAGLWQTFARFPALFSSHNRMRFHFLSHKFARLALPWFLLLAFGAALALPASWWRTAILSGVAAALCLAALDRWLPKGFPLKRLSSPARTFLMMNTASLAAPVVFFIRPQTLWVPTQVKK